MARVLPPLDPPQQNGDFHYLLPSARTRDDYQCIVEELVSQSLRLTHVCRPLRSPNLRFSMLKYTSTCYRVYKHYHHNINSFYVTSDTTRMPSSRMRTARLSCRLSCTYAHPLAMHPPPLFETHIPSDHAHPPHHKHPPFTTRPPLPCPPFRMTDRQRRKNTTYLQLPLRAVTIGKYRKRRKLRT